MIVAQGETMNVLQTFCGRCSCCLFLLLFLFLFCFYTKLHLRDRYASVENYQKLNASNTSLKWLWYKIFHLSDTYNENIWCMWPDICLFMLTSVLKITSHVDSKANSKSNSLTKSVYEILSCDGHMNIFSSSLEWQQ